MAAESIIERSFSGGEIAPALYARTDHTKYTTGLRTMRNHIAMRHGGATQRPGTMYVATTLNGGNPVRLIPFIFNETGLGQSYVLEFGNQYIAFYQNGGVVLSGGNPYTIVSPYLQADLATLKFAESADVITIVHPNYAPMELTRVAPTNWVLSTIIFGAKTGFVTFTLATGVAGANSYLYVVTTVLANGDEGNFAGSRTALVVNVQEPSPTNPINLAWYGAPLITGILPVLYRVYRSTVGTNAGPFGYVGTVVPTSLTNPGIATNFTDDVGTPDYTNAPPVMSPFETNMGPGYYPSTVGFIQQRRIFGAWNNNQLGVAMSRPGSYSNFDIHQVTTPDDDPIFFSLAGEEVNSIESILELKFMVMLTTGSEVFVQGNGTGIVTPSAINASVQSYYGANPLRPLKVGEVCIYVQALGNFVRDLVFDFVIDGYRGNDLTIFSSHLFEGHQIVDWAYQKIPDSIVWAVREDGVLLSLTYIREQQILAWARHDFTNGFVENVVSIPENGNYAVYVVVRRLINGATVRYIERLSSRIWSDPFSATYLDCFSLFDGRNTNPAVTMQLFTPSGGFDPSTQAYTQRIVLTCVGSGYFNAGMIGDEICIQDALFVSSQGTQGNQIRCTIQTYIDSTDVIVTPNRSVPLEFRNIPTNNFSHAVKTLTGLGFLEGQTVSVWADRFVVGSPLNPNITQTYTVTGGSITLDRCYSVIYVGLPMTADLETLAIDTTFGDSVLQETKNISTVAVFLYNSRGFFGGTQNPDTDPDNIINGIVQNPLFNLYELKAQEGRLTYDAPVSLMTDPQYSNVECSWTKEGRIFIRNVDPIPLSVLAIVPAGLTSAKVAWSQKV